MIPTRLDEAGWTYTPIAESGAVEQLLILRNPDQLPAGIIGLLAQREGGGWTISAWITAAYEEIVLYIADQTGQEPWEIASGLHDDIALDWEMLEAPGVVGVAPAPLGSGVLSGDPLEPIIEGADDPITLLEVLELLGYPAVAKISSASTVGGTVPVDPPTPGPDECVFLVAGDWFDLLGESFEAEIAEAGTGFWVFQDLLQAQQPACTCDRREWYSNESWTLWSCGGSWTVVSSGLIAQFHTCSFSLERIVTRSGTRIKFCQDTNCTITQCSQYMSCSAYQTTTCFVPAIPTMPPGGTCQGVAPCNPVLPCMPDRRPSPQCTNWFPACACP